MPLDKKEVFANGNETSLFCSFCTNSDGSVKSVEEIFEGGVQFYLHEIGGDRQKAERFIRKNMNKQPYWKGKSDEILKGEVATDEEFAEVMKKL
jgi:hypothetical protein